MPHAQPRQFLLAILLTLCLAATAIAQQPVVSVDLQPDTCTIGDDVFCTLTILKKSSIALNYPPPNDTVSFTPFEIRRVEKLASERKDESDNIVTEKVRYTLAVFDTGVQRLPKFSIAYLNEQTQKQDTLTVPSSRRVYVASILDTSKKDIADIKPVQTIPIPVWVWLAGAGGLILLGLAGVLIYRRLKNRVKVIAPTKVELAKSPYELAMEKLRALENAPLESQADVKKYYIDLSDATREFLERHYGFPAMEQLTSEINETLLRRRPREEAEQVKRLLEKADLVKFAKFYASAPEAKESLQAAYQVVDIAKPNETLNSVQN